jgi:hypothetical protein
MKRYCRQTALAYTFALALLIFAVLVVMLILSTRPI